MGAVQSDEEVLRMLWDEVVGGDDDSGEETYQRSRDGTDHRWVISTMMERRKEA